MKSINQFLGDPPTTASSSGEEKLYSGTWLVVTAVAGGVLGFFIGSAVGSVAGLVVGDKKATERELHRMSPAPSSRAAVTETHRAPTSSKRAQARTERVPETEANATIGSKMGTTINKLFAPSSGKTMVSAT